MDRLDILETCISRVKFSCCFKPFRKKSGVTKTVSQSRYSDKEGESYFLPKKMEYAIFNMSSFLASLSHIVTIWISSSESDARLIELEVHVIAGSYGVLVLSVEYGKISEALLPCRRLWYKFYLLARPYA